MVSIPVFNSPPTPEVPVHAFGMNGDAGHAGGDKRRHHPYQMLPGPENSSLSLAREKTSMPHDSRTSREDINPTIS